LGKPQHGKLSLHTSRIKNGGGGGVVCVYEHVHVFAAYLCIYGSFNDAISK